MRSDWERVKAYIEATNVGTTFSKFTAEDLSEFADALYTVFQDVVFVLVNLGRVNVEHVGNVGELHLVDCYEITGCVGANCARHHVKLHVVKLYRFVIDGELLISHSESADFCHFLFLLFFFVFCFLGDMADSSLTNYRLYFSSLVNFCQGVKVKK